MPSHPLKRLLFKGQLRLTATVRSCSHDFITIENVAYLKAKLLDTMTFENVWQADLEKGAAVSFFSYVRSNRRLIDDYGHTETEYWLRPPNTLFPQTFRKIYDPETATGLDLDVTRAY